MASFSLSESRSSKSNIKSDNGSNLQEIRVSVAHDPNVVESGEVQDQNALDNAILRAQGYDPAMPRSFSVMSSLGLAFSITNSWAGYSSNFGQNLMYDGPQSVVFGLIIATVIQWLITLGLSEISSAFPSSGGQYHFVHMLAPEKHKRFGAFVVGWLSILAWWTVTCSGVSLAATSLLGLANFWYEDWVPDNWHIYIVFLAISLLTSMPLYLCPKQIPRIAQSCMYLSVVGFIVAFITILIMQKQKQPGSFITEHLGTSGWDHRTAWMLGISNAMYAYGGTDGVIHIAEEMNQPGKRIPQIMSLTMLIGGITAVPFMLAMMFCITDLGAVLASPLPVAQVYYQATGSKEVTTFLASWLIVIFIMALPSQWVTSGRIAWAFARDNGTPYSKYFAHIDPTRKFPVRTTTVAVIFVCWYGLLYLASKTAFNSIITSAVLFLNITYVVPQTVVLFQGRERSLPKRYLNLGYLGYFCNIFATIWIVVLGVLACLPPKLPVAADTMNYASVILVGLFGIIILFWFKIRENFTGPKLNRDELSALNQGRCSLSH